MRVAGVWIMPTIFARNSSSDGSAASASTPLASRLVRPMAPPSRTNFSFVLANSAATFGAAIGIIRIGDDRRTLEQVADVFDVRTFQSKLDEAVLGDLEAGPGVPHAAPKGRHLGDVQAGIVGHHHNPGVRKHLVEGGHHLAFFSSIHCLCPHLAGGSLARSAGRFA